MAAPDQEHVEIQHDPGQGDEVEHSGETDHPAGEVAEIPGYPQVHQGVADGGTQQAAEGGYRGEERAQQRPQNEGDGGVGGEQ